MTEPRTRKVNTVVSHAIANYELTSKSKLFRRLTHKNVGKISKALIDMKQDLHLMELLKKRDYYTRRINELLNDSGEETDPRLIQDEDEAEHYIRKRLLRDHTTVQQIKDLVAKHKYFQETSAREQDQIMARYLTKCPSLGDLKKFNSMNAASDAKHQSDQDAELLQFYTNLMNKQSEYSLESERILRHLGVPFFSLPVEQLQASGFGKLFVLNLLYVALGGDL